jgi:hypothetical protein
MSSTGGATETGATGFRIDFDDDLVAQETDDGINGIYDEVNKMQEDLLGKYEKADKLNAASNMLADAEEAGAETVGDLSPEQQQQLADALGIPVEDLDPNQTIDGAQRDVDTALNSELTDIETLTIKINYYMDAAQKMFDAVMSILKAIKDALMSA